jgi:hypothetical protein
MAGEVVGMSDRQRPVGRWLEREVTIMSNQGELLDQDVATTGRRQLITKAGAAAAVAAVAGLAASQSAEAADGGNMLIGRVNTGIPANTTRLTGGTSFYVVNGVSPDGDSASIRGSASTANYAGVKGASSGSSGKGVYGVSTGSAGVGVYGASSGSNGVGVYGATTAIGTDAAGVFGRNTGDGPGVKGYSTDTSSAGVYGVHSTSGGRGVYGHFDNSSSAGTGVLGLAALGVGVEGRGSEYDVLANGNGRVGLAKAGNSGSPTATGAVGTIARDAAGILWYCYATNKWQRLGGPAAAGAFHPIAPVRVLDTRKAAFPSDGVFTASTSRVISVKDGRDKDTGAVTAANAVPEGATAVTFNVTAVDTGSRNFLAVVPGDVTTTSVSTVNWPGPVTAIANASVSKLDGSRQLRIIAGPGGTFHAIIDITGYYI